MSRELASIRLLREALEAVMPPARAAGVLFEGLGAWGERVPVTGEELRSALDGPIRAALAKRLPPEQVDGVVTSVRDALTTAEAPTDVHPVLPDPDATTGKHRRLAEREDETTRVPTADAWPDEQTTIEIQAHPGGPVPVVVLAGSESFAIRMSLALGPERVVATAIASLDALAPHLRDAAVVVVDATDVPDAAPLEVSRALSRLPQDCVPAVWGGDLPFGERVAQALGDAGQRCVAVSTEEGIDPLVDLVRSRL